MPEARNHVNQAEAPAALLARSDVSQNMGAQPGCMSGALDPECPAIFEQLGWPS